jgi:hypothetical protein
MDVFESVRSVQLNSSGIVMSDAVAESMAIARLILNEDFLGVELAEMAGVLPFVGEIPEMAVTLSQLQKIHGDWILMAMPPVSLATIVTAQPLSFNKGERNEMRARPFARKADPRWQWVMIRKQALGWVPNTEGVDTFNKKLGSYPLPTGHDCPEGTTGGRGGYFAQQKKLIGATERVAYAREIAYAAMAYRLQTGRRLFEYEYVRCMDVFMDEFGDSQRACFGMNSEEGMSFRGFSDSLESSHYHLGVARDATQEAEEKSSK